MTQITIAPCPDDILQIPHIVELRRAVHAAYAKPHNHDHETQRAIAEERRDARNEGRCFDYSHMPEQYFAEGERWAKQYGDAATAYAAAKNHECWKRGLPPCELSGLRGEAVGYGPQ